MKRLFNQGDGSSKEPLANSTAPDSGVADSFVDNILQSMKSMLMVINPEGTIRLVNQAALDILGYTEEELVGAHFNSKILGESSSDPERLSATLLLSKQFTRNVSQRFYHHDGHLIPVSVSSAIMRNNEGHILGVVCVAHDETERYKAEKRIRFQAELMESVSDAIIATDKSLKIISWNNAAEQVYGRRSREVIGKPLAEVLQNEDPISNTLEIEAIVNIWPREQRHHRKDGGLVHTLSSASLMYDEHDHPTGMVIVNHDITQRKIAEQQLERRLEQLALLRQIESELGHTLEMQEVLKIALQAVVGLSGATFGFVAVLDEQHQNAIFEIYGHKNGEMRVSDILAHPLVQQVIRTFEAENRINPNSSSIYAAVLRPDTQAVMTLPLLHQQKLVGVILLESSSSAEFDEEMFDFMRLLASRISVAVDNARLYLISQNQLAELKTLYGQLSKLEQLKTDMIRIASHDLRSPIGLINGYLMLLESDLADRIQPSEADFIHEIMRAVQRMEQITGDILSLERIQQVAEDDYSEMVDLVELAERGVRSYFPQAGLSKQTLYFNKPDSLKMATVQGDPAQLYEAISNLISNAIKYTPEGGDITVALKLPNPDRIEFTVTDTGYGIPESEQAKLFQPFSRASSTETAAIKGTGLGLHLVKNIIDRHHGRIVFHSEYQKGSTFGFSMPLVRNAD